MERVLSWASSRIMTCKEIASGDLYSTGPRASSDQNTVVGRAPALKRFKCGSTSASRTAFLLPSSLDGIWPKALSVDGSAGEREACLVPLQVWVYEGLAYQHAICEISDPSVSAACVIKAHTIANLHKELSLLKGAKKREGTLCR